MRTLSSNEIIVAMLEFYMELCGPGDMGAGSDYPDSRPLQYHPLWLQGSFFELARCLLLMRDEEKHLYWNVAERYLRATTRITMGCPGCGKATSEGIRHSHHDGMRARRFDRGRIVEHRWHPRVDLAKVDAGISWIAAEHRGPPYLPTELYALLAA